MLVGVTVDVRLQTFGVRYPQCTQEQRLALGLEVPIYVQYVCMYVYLYVCMCVRMYVYLYVRTYVCMYVCTYVRMYVRTYVCMFICLYLVVYSDYQSLRTYKVSTSNCSGAPRDFICSRGIRLRVQVLPDLVTGIQNTAFCWKNEMQRETTDNTF
jgi:hypothetical protein